LSLQLLARSGVTLLGRILAADGATVTFDDSAAANIAFGDQFARRVCTMVDALIDRTGVDVPPAEPDEGGGSVDVGPRTAMNLDDAGVSSIIWCTGFTGDFSWVRLPVLDDAGQPRHRGGATSDPGVWFVGLPWLTRRKSGIFFGFPDDADKIADEVKARPSLRR
jgi:putative flavoprotein involved in K+ transport